uniref:PB1-like domain-containing protein n=1 Tax=Tanacetum cinerariifolium TaxID=118510 RepID=A0A699HUD5_TANCI|nr:hypothetical protein [Tanacetum cinerariifolium]
MFSLKLNYVCFFTESPGRTYVNGDFSFFDCIDIDEFLVHELNDMAKKLGFSGKTIMYYSFLRRGMNLDNGLYTLGNNDDVRRMVEYIRLGYKMIEAYIKHDKTTVYTYIKDAYNTPSKRWVIMELHDGVQPQNASQSKMKPKRAISGSCAKKINDENRDDDSSDSDELVDKENELVDVAVNMNHFDRVNANTIGNEDTPKFNAYEEFDINTDVIDNEEFEIAFNKDGINMIMERKLKQLKKQSRLKDGGLHKVYFFVGQEFLSAAKVKELEHKHSIETRRELYLKKIDQVRVMAECKGTIHMFNNSSDVGPSQVVGPSKVSGSSRGVMKIPLLEYFATVSAKEFPLLSCSVAPAEEFSLLVEIRITLSQRRITLSQRRVLVILGMYHVISLVI